MDLFQFEWRVAARGYRIREAVPLDRPMSEKGHYFLTDEKSAGAPGRGKIYAPLEVSGLFRTFADLAVAEEKFDAIAKFANRYGVLGHHMEQISFPDEPQAPHWNDPSNRIYIGERVSLWTSEITKMHNAVVLWDLAGAKKAGALKKFIRWDESGNRVWYTSDPSFSGDLRRESARYIDMDEERPEALRAMAIGSGHIDAGEHTVVPITYRGQPEFQQIRKGDVIHPAWLRIQQVLNSALYGDVSPRLLWGENGLRLHHAPGSLRGAMWLQFAQAVSGKKAYRDCVQCGTWFEVQPGVGRKDKKYCSDSCRAAAYRKRKEAKS